MLLAHAPGLGHHQERGSVLETAAGVQAVVLHPEPVQAERRAQLVRPDQGSAAHRKRRVELGLHRAEEAPVWTRPVEGRSDGLVVEYRFQHAREGCARTVALAAFRTEITHLVPGIGAFAVGAAVVEIDHGPTVADEFERRESGRRIQAAALPFVASTDSSPAFLAVLSRLKNRLSRTAITEANRMPLRNSGLKALGIWLKNLSATNGIIPKPMLMATM